MLIRPGDGWAVLASSATWTAVSLVVGLLATRWPPRSLDRTGPVTTLRPWERDGGLWQRHLRVRSWKTRVPDAGAFFDRGTSKRSVPSRATGDLRAFRRETVRAERVHWTIMASTPLHLIWCRPVLMAAMAAFGVASNAPFILIQRVNRGSIDRVLARRRRTGGTGAVAAVETGSAAPARDRDAPSPPPDLAQQQGSDRRQGEDADEPDHQ